MRWCIRSLRLRKETATIRSYLEAVRDLYQWAELTVSPFDPEGRMREVAIFSAHEVQSLAAFVQTAGGAKRSKKVPGRRSVSDASNRMSRIRDFVSWCFEHAMPPVPSDTIARQRKLFDSFRIKPRSQKRKEGISEAAEKELRRLVRPGEQGNPFREQVRIRNELVIRVLLETGFRRGELCKLRISDLQTRGDKGPTLRLERVLHDYSDPRLHEPRAKTRPRLVPISDGLANDLHSYVRNFRGRQKHPYLFVSSASGRPLSLCSINSIVTRLKRSSPSLSKLDLHPHILRYTFTDRIWQAARRQGRSADEIIPLLNFLCGWTENSSQSLQYGKRAIEEDAMEVLQRFHEQNSRALAGTGL